MGASISLTLPAGTRPSCWSALALPRPSRTSLDELPNLSPGRILTLSEIFQRRFERVCKQHRVSLANIMDLTEQGRAPASGQLACLAQRPQEPGGLGAGPASQPRACCLPRLLLQQEVEHPARPLVRELPGCRSHSSGWLEGVAGAALGLMWEGPAQTTPAAPQRPIPMHLPDFLHERGVRSAR